MPNSEVEIGVPAQPSGDMVAKTESSWSKQVIQYLAAIVALVAFAFLACKMMAYAVNVDVNDEKWSRLIHIYSGVESIIFAAAGVLFGTAVQTPRIYTAKKQAEAAEQVAETEAAKGRELAKKVIEEQKNPDQSVPLGAASSPQPTNLQLLAKTLYPDLR